MTLTAEQRSEVSRKNGSRSRGPKTPEGKKQSSMNALKHGMRAKALAMANEDPEAVAARSTSWIGYYQPKSPAAQHLVNLCISSTLLSDRCQRAHDAELADQVDDTALLWEKERWDAVETLKGRLDDDPGEAVAALEATGHGCRWMIARWGGLGRALQERGSWGPYEADEATRLMGADPDRLADDPLAYLAVVHNLRCQPEPDEALIDDLTGPECRPAGLRTIDRDAWLPGPSECRYLLEAMVADRVDRLIELERVRAAADAAERGRALDRALVLRDGESARLILRYHAESRTAFHRAYKDLVATLERDARGESEGSSPDEPADEAVMPAPEGVGSGGFSEVLAGEDSGGLSGAEATRRTPHAGPPPQGSEGGVFSTPPHAKAGPEEAAECVQRRPASIPLDPPFVSGDAFPMSRVSTHAPETPPSEPPHGAREEETISTPRLKPTSPNEPGVAGAPTSPNEPRHETGKPIGSRGDARSSDARSIRSEDSSAAALPVGKDSRAMEKIAAVAVAEAGGEGRLFPLTAEPART
jgi:hypothetical protein